MSNLRRRAIKGPVKTTSRKAQLRSENSSPVVSPGSSKPGSRVASRAGSQAGSANASDDEFDADDYSVAFDNEDLTLGSIDESINDPIEALDDRIEEILDRKRSSVQGREHTLAVYSAILRNTYCRDFIDSRTMEVLQGIMNSVRAESSERETVFALKAVILTIITDPQEEMFHLVNSALKRVISYSQSMLSKTEAIHALGLATFFGGADTTESEAVMQYLLEIIDTDGEYVEAHNDSHVITAACQEWGLLASQLEELEHLTDEAMDTFMRVLNSNSVNVQIAAGENIALIYEKSYQFKSPASSTHDTTEAANEPVQIFQPYGRTDLLLEKCAALSKFSSKRTSKNDRKSLHLAFADILNSLQNPGVGPRFSTALKADDSGGVYGSRLKLRMGRGHIVTVNEWAMLLRLQALRRALGGGWMSHVVDNEIVEEAIVGGVE